jgi:hypothetical protein
MRPTPVRFVVGFAIALGATAAIRAELIQFTFSGKLSEVTGAIPAPWDGIEVGSPFAVSYVFDSEAPDQAGGPSFGFYEILSLSVTIDGIALGAIADGIEVDLTSPVLHEYIVFFQNVPIGATGSIHLTDFDESFESDDLPLTLDLDEFESKFFEVIQNDGGFGIFGAIKHLEVATIPGASGAPLFVLALLSCRRRRACNHASCKERGVMRCNLHLSG